MIYECVVLVDWGWHKNCSICRELCPSASLSTTSSTWNSLGL